MATQGLITVTRHNKSAVKIVTGADGYNISTAVKQLRQHIKANPDTWQDLPKLYLIAQMAGFGSPDSLIVFDSQHHYQETGDDELPPLYLETFDKPGFNPRWSKGIAEYSEIIELSDL